MKPIDNVHHAIATALTERIDLSRIAITAWRKPEVATLATNVVQALGINKPETELDDILPGAMIDTVTGLTLAHSKGKSSLIDNEDLWQCEDEYVALLKRASDSDSKEFVQHAKRKVHAAIELSIAARLDFATLEERMRARPIGESLSFVTEVADYYRDFKRQSNLIDLPDLFASDFEPIQACTLCLIKRRDVPLLALQALKRMLPKAFFCIVATDSR